jgi:SPP1 gp7 family putative phage head morphogenesis protein
VENELTSMVATGKSPDKSIKVIMNKFGVSRYNASRLIMTESAYFNSLATKDELNELGVDQFEILATLDSRTSSICRSMDGKHFNVKDYQVGVTAPPFHPHCRTTTVPYFDDEFTVDEERAARNARFARGASTWALTGPGGGTNKDIM